MKIQCGIIRKWDSSVEEYIELNGYDKYYIRGFYEKNNRTIAVIEDAKTHMLETTDIDNIKIDES